MEEATVVRFCRQPGEAFRKGDPLYEIETEKISQEVTATDDGVMVEHAVPAGSDVRVGERCAWSRPTGVPDDARVAAAPELFHIGWVVRDCDAAQRGPAHAPRRGPVPEHGRRVPLRPGARARQAGAGLR